MNTKRFLRALGKLALLLAFIIMAQVTLLWLWHYPLGRAVVLVVLGIFLVLLFLLYYNEKDEK